MIISNKSIAHDIICKLSFNTSKGRKVFAQVLVVVNLMCMEVGLCRQVPLCEALQWAPSLHS